MKTLISRTILSLVLCVASIPVAIADLPPPMSLDELVTAVEAVVELRGERPLLLIGELHGSWEAPRIAFGVVERLAEGGPVRLALEVNVQEQARVQAFLASDGGPDARAALLAGAFWQRPAERSDGRRSEAMLELLQRVRQLRVGGADIEIALIDDEAFHQEGTDRMTGMAVQLERLASMDEMPVIALIGNYHARRAPVRGQLLVDGKPLDAPPTPTAMRIGKVDFTSVHVAACSGSHWACLASSCGGNRIDGVCPAGGGTRVQTLQADVDGYDLGIVLPRLTASPPVTPGMQ